MFIENKSDHDAIDGVTVSNNLGTGLLTDSTVTNLSLSGITAFGNGGYGVNLGTQSAALTASIVHDNTQAGIYATGSVTVSGSTVYDSTTGIMLDNGGMATGNVVYGCSTGIQLGSYPSYSATASNNRVYDNSLYGILAYDNSQVLGNTVYSNDVGIEAEANGHAMSLTNNLVYANTSDGMVLLLVTGRHHEQHGLPAFR